MTERTLKYAHEEKCPAVHPPKPRVRKSKIQQEEPPKPEPTYEEAPAPQPLKRHRGDSLQMLKNRVARLKDLGAKAINEIQ